MKQDEIAKRLKNNQIYMFYKDAINEYEQNGRSGQFKAMEDRIIKCGKPIQIYWFARYVKGSKVTIRRCQNAIINNASPEYWYYFAKFVKGADLKLFWERACELNDPFWKKKFKRILDNRLNPDSNRKNKTDDALSCFERNTSSEIEWLIQMAQTEIQNNGFRTQKFIECEAEAYYSDGEIRGIMFAQYVPQADIKALEMALLMSGKPSALFMASKNVNGIDKNNMLAGAQIARLEYIGIEEEFNNREKFQNDAYFTADIRKAEAAYKSLNILIRRSQGLIDADNYALLISNLK